MIEYGYRSGDEFSLSEISDACFEGMERVPLGFFDNEDVLVWKCYTLTQGTIGFAAVKLSERTLYYIAIRPAMQKFGYGAELLNAVVTDLRQRGIQHLWLTVREDNPAQMLYFKHGFRVRDVLPDYYGPDMYGVRMRKTL